jgi:hypothetical protein
MNVAGLLNKQYTLSPFASVVSARAWNVISLH